ncbi:MAG: HAD family hydrolase [Gemmataceae bacterium]|nr:HAD family hydrolase [Gemmata sp.]MDW8197944.1 HAD family hydrolase [Gemmataceae bacterium]
MPRRVVFLDRDGVINRAFPEGKTTRPPRCLDELELLPGVPDALHRLHTAGYGLIVVTNQPDVARGTLAQSTVEAIHAQLVTQLPILDIFTCFHDSSDRCRCRKPQPGLLLAAAAQWDVNLSEAFLIGDRWSDIAAAQAAGCRGVLIETPFSHAERCTPDHRASTITEAVDWILAHQQTAIRWQPAA